MGFQTVKGMRDFMPEEMIKRNRVFARCRNIFERYGYGEIQTPAIEYLDLLVAKGGLGEDAVKDIYRFKDKGGREVGLRFDLTTPICRIIARNPNFLKPVKWYYIDRMWRYEDVGLGRKREFWQAGIELIGSKYPTADAEVLAITADCLLEFGIKKFTLRVNNRKILEGLMKDLDIDANKSDIFRTIDKLDKIGEAEVRNQLKKYLSDDKILKIMKFIKSDIKDAEKMLSGNSQAMEGFEQLKRTLKLLSDWEIDKYIKVDFSIMRGLDYYTDFIFETFVDGFEKLGSVCGGGRYDSLIEMYGGVSTPATGMSIGIERIVDIMNEENMFPKDILPVDCFVASAKDNMRDEAIQIAQNLRRAGIRCETDLLERKLSKQMECASQLKTPYIVIVGEREYKEKKIVLRNMKTGSEKLVEIKNLDKELGKLLSKI